MARADNTANGEGVQAVALALRVLEYLAHQRDPVGVTALAQALDISKSRVHRHLRTLVNLHYVVQAADSDRYRVGMRLVTLGQAISDNFDFTVLARPVMRALRDELGHSVALSQLEPNGARVIATLPGSSAVEIGVKPGSLLGFHTSAQGKVLLAFGDEAARNRVMRGRLEMLTPHTITGATALGAELDRIRAQGWAVAPDEALIGVNALAAPLFGASGLLLGALAVVDSVQYIEATPAREVIERVVQAAARISLALGHNPSRRPGIGEQQKTGGPE